MANRFAREVIKNKYLSDMIFRNLVCNISKNATKSVFGTSCRTLPLYGGGDEVTSVPAQAQYSSTTSTPHQATTVPVTLST
jgi:hypothetical protein